MVPVLFVTFIVCLFAGVPVAFSLGISSLAYFIGAGMPIQTFAQRFFCRYRQLYPAFVFRALPWQET